jgi:phosphoribosylformylglycinamidine synthase
VTHGFKDEGDIIALLGVTNEDLSVSEYARTILGKTTDDMIAGGVVPQIDLALEKRVQDACLKLVEAGLLQSAHDCSDGGLAITIVESCFSSLGRDMVGAKIELESSDLPNEAVLFSESPSRIVISFAAEDLERVKEVTGDCPVTVIGTVSDDMLHISIGGSEVVASPVADLEAIWESSLERKLESGVAAAI